ncbi:hypothetical protein KMI_09g14760 [Encephalitozoon hellem]|nr:hypothetical protein KMI_09g14760 [Encephalitozoon hellem]
MLLFLRDFWIEKTIHEQIYDWHWRRRQQTSFNAQMIEIGKKRKDGGFEVCVSDSRHFIDSILTKESIEVFGKEIACGVEDIRGCYITVDKFHYGYRSESKRFFMCIESFTYCGGECDTYGEPCDINEACFLKSLASSPLYMRFRPEELVVHRASIEGMDEDRRSYLMMMLKQNNDFCGNGCYLCKSCMKSDAESCSHRPLEPKVKRYNPFGGRSLNDSNAREGASSEKIYIFDGVYVEKESSGEGRNLEGKWLDLCSDSSEGEHDNLL